MFALALLAPLYWLIARIRGAIVLDENGVRWRTAFSGWKTARWNEIESYDARLTSTTTQWKFVVFTRNGAFSWTRAFQNAEKWAPFAAQFCPQIAANIEDWPRVYNYRSVENGIPILAFPLFCWWLIAPLWALFSSSPRQWMEQIEIQVAMFGWPLTLLGLFLFAAFGTLLPAALLWLFWQMWTQSQSRRAEFFTVTKEGLKWQRAGHEPLFVAWPELHWLHTHSGGKRLRLPEYRLETARGELSWNHGLGGWAHFNLALREHAPQLLQTSARHASDSLSNASMSGAETLIFDFKTRSLRSLLVLMTFVSLLCLGFAIFGPPPNRNEPVPTWFFVICFLVTSVLNFGGVMLFQRGSIRLDTRGIEWKMPWTDRFVAWEEIQQLSLGREAFLRVGEKKLPLYIGPTPPAHFEVFLQEIASRATNAKPQSDEISSPS